MSEKRKFGSKAGLIAATVGSAVGLGNIWRFPNEVHTNGGASFLIIYVLCMAILGIPVMLAEFSLGRGTGTDTVGAFRKHTPKSKWWIVGVVALSASYLINCFYMVVAGWTMEYLVSSATGTLYDNVGNSSGEIISGYFSNHLVEYIGSVWLPIIWTIIVIFINFAILTRGVKKGIERMSNLLMPLLFILLLALCGVALTLPDATEGIKWFLTPDFSKITSEVVINALGQAFFSLSLGMGILITYSSYFPKNDNLKGTAMAVALGDFIVALLMGFIIFPCVMSFGLSNNPDGLESIALVFITLPEVFVRMGYAEIWSTLFFSLLFIAALTSTISISEVSVRFLQDHFRLSRIKSVAIVLAPLLILSPLCSLSQGSLSHITVAGLNLFSLLDTVTTNYLLPTAALLTCIYVGWIIPNSFLQKELTNNGSLSKGISPIVIFLIRYIAPILITGILISQIC